MAGVAALAALGEGMPHTCCLAHPAPVSHHPLPAHPPSHLPPDALLQSIWMLPMAQ